MNSYFVSIRSLKKVVNMLNAVEKKEIRKTLGQKTLGQKSKNEEL